MCNIICQLYIEPDEGPTTLHASLRATDFLIFFHTKTDNCTQATLDHPSITKAASIGYF